MFGRKRNTSWLRLASILLPYMNDPESIPPEVIAEVVSWGFDVIEEAGVSAGEMSLMFAKVICDQSESRAAFIREVAESLRYAGLTVGGDGASNNP